MHEFGEVSAFVLQMGEKTYANKIQKPMLLEQKKFLDSLHQRNDQKYVQVIVALESNLYLH